MKDPWLNITRTFGWYRARNAIDGITIVFDAEERRDYND